MSLSPFSLRTTPDHVLLADLRRLAASDTELEAELLVHLGEVDARKLHLAQGFSSLFVYCMEVLHFSESVAFQRICAVRAARAFPLILERVRSGELHLSGLRLLVPHLTQANHVELLDRARHRSKRAIEEMLADRAPKPDAPAEVRRVIQPPAAPAALELPATTTTTTTTSPEAESVARIPMPCPAPSRPEGERPSSEPLGESRYKIQFTAGPEPTPSCARRRLCCATRSPTGTTRGSSSAPSTRCCARRGAPSSLRLPVRVRSARTSRARQARPDATSPRQSSAP